MVAPSSRGEVAVGAGRRVPARLIMLRPGVSARVLGATDAPGRLLVFSASWHYFASTSPIRPASTAPVPCWQLSLKLSYWEHGL